MDARKYYRWYMHFRAHRQDPETARDSAIAWTTANDEEQAHRERYAAYWTGTNRTTAAPEPPQPPQPTQPQPEPRKRRRTYTDPTTPDQPTLF